jgi:predicted PurR-regulated permease PerM
MQLSTGMKSGFAWLAIAFGLALVIWLLGPVLTPFLIAAVIAYALAPLVRIIQAKTKNKIPEAVTVLLVEILFIVAVAGLLLLIVPILTKELPLLKQQVPVLFERAFETIQPILSQMGINTTLDVASIKGFVVKYLSTNFDDAFGQIMSSLKIGGSVAMTVISNAILVPVALFYFLLEWDTLVQKLLAWVPRKWRPAVDRFANDADAVLGQYLHGQLLVMLSLAVFYSVGMLLFGLDLALPIGIFTGLAVFVPYLGFGLGLVLAILAGLLQFASLKALVMVAVVYGAGQIIESVVLTPKLVGDRIGLHPLAVIFSLLAFAQLLGFVGVLIALPASAVLLVAFRRMQQAYLSSSLYTS